MLIIEMTFAFLKAFLIFNQKLFSRRSLKVIEIYFVV